MRLLLIATLIASFPALALAEDWNIIPDHSTIKFTALYNNEPIEGSFPGFNGEISFDPKALEKARVRIEVPLASVTANDPNAQESLPGGEWFDAKSFPMAVFDARHFKALEGGQFEVSGTLSIRGASVPVTFPFTLDIYDGDGPDVGRHFARATAQTSLQRLSFGIGQGQWKDTALVADEVKINIHLEASSKP